MRPAQRRIDAAVSHLEDLQIEVLFCCPLSDDWQGAARSLVQAVECLSDPEAEAELWEHLGDLRAAVEARDSGAAWWLADRAVQELRLGHLWPSPLPADADAYCAQVWL